MLRSLLLLVALALSACRPSPEAAPAPAPTPSAAPVGTPQPTPLPLPPFCADLHVDTVTEMVERGVPWDHDSLQAGLPALVAGGVGVIVEAAWIPRADPDPRGTARGKLKRLRAAVQASHGAAAVVTGPDQLEAVLRDGRIAVILALEGGTPLVDGEATLRELRGLGLSMVGLTWTESSRFADSCDEPRSGDASGLTLAGRAMVLAANDMGLMLDVSHMSDEATRETIEASRAPVIASHSNSRALLDVPRNLPDDLLLLLASRGGLVAAMLHSPFVARSRPVTRADVAAHMAGLVDRVGAEHVGIGSDFDGKIDVPAGLRSARDLPALEADLAAAGLSQEELRQVMGASFLRFWREVWDARRQ